MFHFTFTRLLHILAFLRLYFIERHGYLATLHQSWKPVNDNCRPQSVDCIYSLGINGAPVSLNITQVRLNSTQVSLFIWLAIDNRDGNIVLIS